MEGFKIYRGGEYPDFANPQKGHSDFANPQMGARFRQRKSKSLHPPSNVF